ncbi:MAG TPA: hypothetical protein V6D02_03635, partial [Candidatus Obscuribacterales bacterium]
ACPTCGGLGHLVHLPGEASKADAGALEVSAREPIVSSRSLAHPSLKEALNEGLEPHSDLQELDLLNHPNYQESRGGRGSRRRRRRDAPPLSKSNGRTETPRAVTAPPIITPPEPPPVAVPEAAPAVSAAVPTSSRASRGRNGRGDRKPAAPPEKVIVEMTPEEQSIYAMMGISPLVLSPQEIKDPKNTLIQVVLPGERVMGEVTLPEELAPEEPTPEVTVTAPITSPTESPTLIKRSQRKAAAVVEEPILTLPSDEPDQEPTSLPAAIVNDVAETDDIAEAVAEPQEEATSTRRRRRRRSSAHEGDEG